MSHNWRSYDPRVRLSKEQAEKTGSPVYWTGKPCKHGHVTHRYVGSRRCVTCAKADFQKKTARELSTEAKTFGLDVEARRRAEALREQRRLDRELSNDYLCEED